MHIKRERERRLLEWMEYISNIKSLFDNEYGGLEHKRDFIWMFVCVCFEIVLNWLWHSMEIACIFQSIGMSSVKAMKAFSLSNRKAAHVWRVTESQRNMLCIVWNWNLQLNAFYMSTNKSVNERISGEMYYDSWCSFTSSARVAVNFFAEINVITRESRRFARFQCDFCENCQMKTEYHRF